MKRFAALLLVVLMLSGARGAAAQGTGQGYVPFTETIVVDTTLAGWQNTSIIVNGGASISVTGQASCDVVPDPIWPECVTYLGPEGLAGTSASGFPAWLAPGLPRYSLVGSIDGGTPFAIGGSITVTGDGELRVGYNDQQDKFFDNDGRFVVTVTSCRPGNGNGDTEHCHLGAPDQN